MSDTTQRPLTYREHWEVQRLARKHLDPRRFFGWFVGLVFPFVFAASLLFGLLDRLFDLPPATRVAARVVFLHVGFYAIICVVYFQAIRPAIEKARLEFESRRAEPDARSATSDS